MAISCSPVQAGKFISSATFIELIQKSVDEKLIVVSDSASRRNFLTLLEGDIQCKICPSLEAFWKHVKASGIEKNRCIITVVAGNLWNEFRRSMSTVPLSAQLDIRIFSMQVVESLLSRSQNNFFWNGKSLFSNQCNGLHIALAGNLKTVGLALEECGALVSSAYACSETPDMIVIQYEHPVSLSLLKLWSTVSKDKVKTSVWLAKLGHPFFQESDKEEPNVKPKKTRYAKDDSLYPAREEADLFEGTRFFWLCNPEENLELNLNGAQFSTDVLERDTIGIVDECVRDLSSQIIHDMRAKDTAVVHKNFLVQCIKKNAVISPVPFIRRIPLLPEFYTQFTIVDFRFYLDSPEQEKLEQLLANLHAKIVSCVNDADAVITRSVISSRKPRARTRFCLYEYDGDLTAHTKCKHWHVPLVIPASDIMNQLSTFPPFLLFIDNENEKLFLSEVITTLGGMVENEYVAWETRHDAIFTVVWDGKSRCCATGIHQTSRIYSPLQLRRVLERKGSDNQQHHSLEQLKNASQLAPIRPPGRFWTHEHIPNYIRLRLNTRILFLFHEMSQGCLVQTDPVSIINHKMEKEETKLASEEAVGVFADVSYYSRKYILAGFLLHSEEMEYLWKTVASVFEKLNLHPIVGQTEADSTNISLYGIKRANKSSPVLIATVTRTRFFVYSTLLDLLPYCMDPNTGFPIILLTPCAKNLKGCQICKSLVYDGKPEPIVVTKHPFTENCGSHATDYIGRLSHSGNIFALQVCFGGVEYEKHSSLTKKADLHTLILNLLREAEKEHHVSICLVCSDCAKQPNDDLAFSKLLYTGRKSFCEVCNDDLIVSKKSCMLKLS